MEDGGYDGVIMIIIKSGETIRTTVGPKYNNNPAQANTRPPQHCWCRHWDGGDFVN